MEQTHNFKKYFGQNFLSDQTLLSDIADDAGILPTDTVLEIGAGNGALTAALAQRAKKVVAYEIDRDLKTTLCNRFAKTDNVEIVIGDFLKENLSTLEKKLGDNYIVAANLPYYISTPVVMLFAEKAQKIKSLTLTLQKEVGLRLAAKENTSDYGAVTVALAAVAKVNVKRFIGREMFFPVPNVDSVVVRADFCGNRLAIENKENFTKLVRAAFGQRRKTLCNNLISTFGVARQQAEFWLQENGIDIKARGETLSPETFARLSNCLASLTHK